VSPSSVSAVIPVHQSAGHLKRCLQALALSDHPPLEVIVVDDGSTDESSRVALEGGALVVAVPNGPRGPAAARNIGAARARAEILFFVDADVLVHRDSVGKFARCLDEHPDVAAVFGSYDDRPEHPGLVSQYRNLLHHFVHQQGRREASTFWAGCGAVRRQIFEQIGGFDERYTRASIEDIELGGRLRQAGHRIWLRPDLQATHLKRWTFWGVVRSDVRDRAIPWTKLILEQGRVVQDLNTSMRSRASAVAAWTVLASVPGMLVDWRCAWIAVTAGGALAVLNARLYAFFLRKRGIRFTVVAAAMHGLYLLYSSAVFAGLAARSALFGRRRQAATT
jgi:GT2 family glycosyltransferase